MHTDIQRCGSLDQVSRGQKQSKARVVAPARACDVMEVVLYRSRHDADVIRASLLPHNDTRSHDHRSPTERSQEDATTDYSDPQGPTTRLRWLMIVRRKENIEFSAE